MLLLLTIFLCLAVISNGLPSSAKSVPPSTRLSGFPNFASVASKAFNAVRANPAVLIVPAVSVALGSVLPTLIQGVTYGESLYSVLLPVLSQAENAVRKIPFVEGLLKRFVFQKALIFDDVLLPIDYSESISTFLTLTGTSQFSIIKFLAASVKDILSIGGLNKTDPKTIEKFEDFHRDYVNYAIKPRGPFDISNTLPEDYKYFGNGNNLDSTPYFFKTNPFFTASLRSNDDSTFVVDPFGKFGTTYMSDIVSCLDDSIPRVEATFNSDMQLTDIKVFNKTNPNDEIQGYSKELAVTALLYQCSYYAQNIHATTHILHLLMTTAMVHATVGTALHSWAQPYVLNIYLKYKEVETLLYSKVGYLAGPGLTGYRVSDRSKLLTVCRAMLCEWGTYTTAEEYINNFLFPNIKPEMLVQFNILKAFRSHTDLIGKYSVAMDNEFVKDESYNKINSELSVFLKKTGTGVSNVSNIKTWLELMSVTGVLHGSTLSMSRLVLTHSFMVTNSPESDIFLARDALWLSVITGTILGALEDFHVFSNTLPATSPYNVNRVLLEFDAITHNLKAQYFKEISEDPETFKNFGWILSDHGPNLIDGKQLTVTTYI